MSNPTQNIPDVLAVRWIAEQSVSPNGLHEIRAGAVNARERPLVGYAMTYEAAKEIAAAHNTRAAVAELIEADKAYDAALTAWDHVDKRANPAYRAAIKAQVKAAEDRRSSALARVGGAK